MTNVIIPNWPAPANVKAASTTRLQADLQPPHPPYWLKQVHGNHVVRAGVGDDCPEADASFSAETGVVCAIKSADCLPILLADKQGRAIAAIHAGWKGLLAGIIDKTITAMPVPASECLAWLGPCIGPQAFRVRQDVYRPFTEQWPESIAAFNKVNDEQWLADLCLIARQRLNHAGVTNIYGGEDCTNTPLTPRLT